MWILHSPEDEESYAHTFRMASPGNKTLGRAAPADFVVDAPLVSRFHCRLTLDAEGTLTVEDLQSTNGTFVNDAPVDQATLHHGDQLRIGRVHLLVARTEPVEAAPGA